MCGIADLDKCEEMSGYMSREQILQQYSVDPLHVFHTFFFPLHPILPQPFNPPTDQLA